MEEAGGALEGGGGEWGEERGEVSWGVGGGARDGEFTWDGVFGVWGVGGVVMGCLVPELRLDKIWSIR